MARDSSAPRHRAWADQAREVADRAIELIEADRRSGETYDWQAALERVASRPPLDHSQLRYRRPEREVVAEVKAGDQWAVRMVQTDDWPPTTMPGTGNPANLTDY